MCKFTLGEMIHFQGNNCQNCICSLLEKGLLILRLLVLFKKKSLTQASVKSRSTAVGRVHHGRYLYVSLALKPWCLRNRAKCTDLTQFMLTTMP